MLAKIIKKSSTRGIFAGLGLGLSISLTSSGCITQQKQQTPQITIETQQKSLQKTIDDYVTNDLEIEEESERTLEQEHNINIYGNYTETDLKIIDYYFRAIGKKDLKKSGLKSIIIISEKDMPEEKLTEWQFLALALGKNCGMRIEKPAMLFISGQIFYSCFTHEYTHVKTYTLFETTNLETEWDALNASGYRLETNGETNGGLITTWNDGTNVPRYGFIDAYASNNKIEDIAMTVEKLSGWVGQTPAYWEHVTEKDIETIYKKAKLAARYELMDEFNFDTFKTTLARCYVLFNKKIPEDCKENISKAPPSDFLN